MILVLLAPLAACQRSEESAFRDAIGPPMARDAHHERALAALIFEDGSVAPKAGMLPSGSADRHLAEVEQSLRSGRRGAALESAAQAVVAAPERPRALERLGHVLRRLGRAEQAAAAFRTALRHDGNDAAAAAGLAWLASGAGDWPEAVDRWRRVLELAPDHPDAQGRLAAAAYFNGDSAAAREA
ncbi:MAG: tetratricopeptide repeat protein [Acidobacteriota bacterium]